MEGAAFMFQRLLVAIDGSESSLQAAEVAIALASLLRARLDILSVEETLPRYVATHEESSREHLAALEYFNGLQAQRDASYPHCGGAALDAGAPDQAPGRSR